MAFPADGRLIVTAAMDSTIRIWSAPDRSLLRVLPGQAVGVTAMAMTRDGRRLISGGGRGAVLVFDRQNDFKPIRLAAPQPHFKGVRQIALLPDDVHFVSVDADGQSFLWELGETSLSRRPWLDVRCLGGRLRRTGRSRRPGHGPRGRAVRRREGPGLQLGRGRGGRAAAHPPVARDDGGLRRRRPAGRRLRRRPGRRPRPQDGRASRLSGRRDEGRRAPAGLLVRRAAGDRPQGRRAPGRAIAGSGDRGRRRGRCPPGLRHPGSSGRRTWSSRRAATTWPRAPRRSARCGSGGSRATGRRPKSLNDPQAQASLLGFTGNGRGLAIADVSGGVEFRPLDPQGDEAPWAFPAHRGKLQQFERLARPAALLFLDEQRGVRIWDLKERTCRRLPGTYRAGAFIDDNRVVLIPDSNMGKHAGRLILADRTGKWAAAPFFAGQADGFKLPDGIPFQRIAVTPDGGQIAAAADSGKEPLVCVWETKKGLLTHWITTDRLVDPVVALAFSSDGRNLLTGGDSPAARLWDLPARPGELDRAGRHLRGQIDQGEYHLRRDPARRRPAGRHRPQQWPGPRLEVGGRPAPRHARSAPPGRRRVRHRGQGALLHLRRPIPGGVRRRQTDLARRHGPAAAVDRRSGQARARITTSRSTRCCTWRDRPILISGSDDTTIRFWDIEAKVLRGRSRRGAGRPSPARRPSRSSTGSSTRPRGTTTPPRRPPSWCTTGGPSVAAGRAAGSRPRFGLSVGRRPESRGGGQLDQLAAKQNIFGLGEQLLRGEAPGQKPASEAAPPITISVAPPANPAAAEALLKIKMAADDFEEVRLYHNDVPIPSGWDPARKPAAGGRSAEPGRPRQAGLGRQPVLRDGQPAGRLRQLLPGRRGQLRRPGGARPGPRAGAGGQGLPG